MDEPPDVEPDSTHQKGFQNILEHIIQASTDNNIAPTAIENSSPIIHQTYSAHLINPPLLDPTQHDQGITAKAIPTDNHFISQTLPEADDTTHAFTRILQRHHQEIQYPTQLIRVHVDGGANRSITNDKSILTGFRNIK